MIRAGAILVTCLLVVFPGSYATAQQYRTYSEIGVFLQDAENDFPDLCRFYDLGLSVQGRHIWALNISDNVDVEEDEPEVRYAAAIHGDEILGTEMLLRLVELLTTSYDTDPRIRGIVDEMDIWIVPLLNPDGYDRYPRTRYNAQGLDLNRNFPDPYTSPQNTTAGRAPETAAVMNWSFSESCTLAANLHGGALVVNYPFDNNPTGSSVFSPTPDEDLFVFISEAYAQYNAPMWNSTAFFHGITNGAAWYAISGGLQDWSYVYMGTNEVTIEIGDDKQPPASQIPQYWDDNRESLLSYMESSLLGVRGLITDADTGQPVAASVYVVDRDHAVYNDPDVGDYHRMLMPGLYSLRFLADGFDTTDFDDVPVESGAATRLDVAMHAPPDVNFPNGGETLVAGTPVTVTWTGAVDAAFQVQHAVAYGTTVESGTGFETGVLDEVFTSGGSEPWRVGNASSHEGTYAAQAGPVTHGQTSRLSLPVVGPAIEFWYRVSSEAGYDFLDVYVDDELVVHASGLGGWQFFSAALDPGPHLLTWSYTKDGSVSSGSDTAWVDDVQWYDDGTTWSDIVAMTPVGAASTSWTPVEPTASAKVRVRAFYADGGRGAWNESDGPFLVEPGDPDCNGNGVPDDEEPDADDDGVIDDCDECPLDPDKQLAGECGCGVPEGVCALEPPQLAVGGCRYLLVTPEPTTSSAWIRISAEGEGCAARYVAPDPDEDRAADGYCVLTQDVTPYETQDWGTVRLRGIELTPGTTYLVTTGNAWGFESAPAEVTTWAWGDANGNGAVNFEDVLLLVRGFQQDFSLASPDAVDLWPCMPDTIINFDDVLRGVLAFQGQDYAATSCPAACD